MKNLMQDRFRGALLGLLIGLSKGKSNGGVDAAALGVADLTLSCRGTIMPRLFSERCTVDTTGARSLLYMAPIVMARIDQRHAIEGAREVAKFSCADQEFILASEMLATYLWRTINEDGDKASIVAPPRYCSFSDTSPLMAVACGTFRFKRRDEFVLGGGSIADTVEAALGAFWHGIDFASALEMAGDDPVVASIACCLSGAFYGASTIPSDSFPKRAKIQYMADQLRLLEHHPKPDVSNRQMTCFADSQSIFA